MQANGLTNVRVDGPPAESFGRVESQVAFVAVRMVRSLSQADQTY